MYISFFLSTYVSIDLSIYLSIFLSRGPEWRAGPGRKGF